VFRRRRRLKRVANSTLKVEYVCPRCKAVLRVPHRMVKDFSPGGKEYHKGGSTSFVCIKCGAMIPLRNGE